MGIGTSKGAFYRDEGHYAASMWDDRYDDNIVSPQELDDRKEFLPDVTEVKDKMPFPDNRNPDSDFTSRFGNLPPSGILNDLKRPKGETVPLVRRISDTVPAEGKKEETWRDAVDTIFGLNGKERYKFWPERMLDSAQNLAGDVLSGKVPGWEYHEDTGEFHTSMEMIERAGDLAALGVSGNIPMRVRLREPTPREREFPGRTLNEKSQELDALDSLHRNIQNREHRFEYDGSDDFFIRQPELKIASKGKLSDKFSEGDITVSRKSAEATASHKFQFFDEKTGTLGDLHISEMNNGKMLYVDWIGNWAVGPNAMGSKATRDLLRAISKEFPEAEEIAGFRVSGARGNAGASGPARMKLPKIREEKT